MSSKIPENPFILVDGSSYLFRAFHALPPLTTTKGQPTGAIFGVINMLRKLLTEYRPERIAVVFDSKEKNFRHQKYPSYKANRLVMPDDLQKQIEPLFALIRAMGLPLIVIPGVEADDIIGTLTQKAKKEGVFTLISTGDKDFAQLVDDKTFLINTMSQDLFTRKRVIEKFGVPPETIIDYLALIGDSVDNIPGIPKVGPKTALKWLETYKTLDNLVAHAEEIPGKVGENLRDALNILPLFRELVTINVYVPLEFSWKELSKKPADIEKLREHYTELEFKTWLRDIGGASQVPQVSPSQELSPGEDEASASENVTLARKTLTPEHELVLTEAAFHAWVKRLKSAKHFAFDVETTDLNYMLAELVGVSFSVEVGKAAYVPFGHDYPDAPKQLNKEFVLETLRPLLEDEKHLKIGHNIKYDAEVLENYGIKLKGIAFDTMLESYVIDSAGTRHGLDILSEKYLQHRTITFTDVAGKGAKQLSFNQVPIQAACEYAAEDADVTLRLHECLWPRIEKFESLKKVFQEIEMPLVQVLIQMERTGVLVDPKLLHAQSKELDKKMQTLEAEVYDLAGETFNLNSPKQLQEVLYERLKLPVLEKTPTGQPSTAESVMQALAEKYPLPKMILEYRSLSKIKSTYTDKLPNQINQKTGRVHTSYHQAITSTGRLSSSDPNLQNIPIRTAEGRKVRAAFIAEQGYKIVTADYSQIELRIVANLSQDKGLVAAFTQGDDVHKSTAASVFGVPLEQVTKDQRRSAKAINFGLLYGMSSFGLAKQLGISRGQAESHMERYFACFPDVKNFVEGVLKTAKAQGYVETLLGRRLYLPELNVSNVTRRRAAERAAVNAPMQGTNADIIKLAMIQLHHWTITTNDQVRMIMQVHDELVFEVSEKMIDQAVEKIKYSMENVVPLDVPLKVDIGVGLNWDETHGDH